MNRCDILYMKGTEGPDSYFCSLIPIIYPLNPIYMIAVIKTGGKQYIIKEGELLTIEKIPVKAGESAELTEVLLTADDDGGNVEIGTPLLANKQISSEVIEQGKGKKVMVIKYKPKVRYRRKVGHRQPFTKIKIGKV